MSWKLLISFYSHLKDHLNVKINWNVRSCAQSNLIICIGSKDVFIFLTRHKLNDNRLSKSLTYELFTIFMFHHLPIDDWRILIKHISSESLRIIDSYVLRRSTFCAALKAIFHSIVFSDDLNLIACAVRFGLNVWWVFFILLYNQ